MNLLRLVIRPVVLENIAPRPGCKPGELVICQRSWSFGKLDGFRKNFYSYSTVKKQRPCKNLP